MVRKVLDVVLPIAVLFLSSFRSLTTRVTLTVLPFTDLSTWPPASGSSIVGTRSLTIEMRDTLSNRWSTVSEKVMLSCPVFRSRRKPSTDGLVVSAVKPVTRRALPFVMASTSCPKASSIANACMVIQVVFILVANPETDLTLSRSRGWILTVIS